jgi:hypothetical protein
MKIGILYKENIIKWLSNIEEWIDNTFQNLEYSGLFFFRILQLLSVETNFILKMLWPFNLR